MLDHGIRHLPVLAAGRRLLGVFDDVDLMANERRAPFRLRAAIARATDASEVAEAAADLPDTVIALFDAGLAARAISRAIASIHDAVTRRLIEFAHAELGPPAGPVHVAGHGQLRPLRAVPELRRRQRHRVGRPGRRSGAAAHRWPRSPSMCWRASSVRVPARHEGRGRLESAVRPLDRGVGARRHGPGSSTRPRPRPAAAQRGRGERSGLGRDRDGRAPRPGVRPSPRTASSCCEGWRSGAAERPPTGFIRNLVLHERRAQGRARHQARGLLPIESAGALERAARRRERRLHARAPEGVRGGGHAQPRTTRRTCATPSSCSRRSAWSTRSAAPEGRRARQPDRAQSAQRRSPGPR